MTLRMATGVGSALVDDIWGLVCELGGRGRGVFFFFLHSYQAGGFPILSGRFLQINGRCIAFDRHQYVSQDMMRGGGERAGGVHRDNLRRNSRQDCGS